MTQHAPPASHFYYFAYGSNLKLSEMQRTCPSATRVFRAMLPAHRLVFPRFSRGRNCGVASVEEPAVGAVWGGIYSIQENELSALQAREGYLPGRPLPANSYCPQHVVILEEGRVEKPHRVLTFVANRQPNPPAPSLNYKNLIVSGAQEWKLPSSYLECLKEIQALNS